MEEQQEEKFFGTPEEIAEEIMQAGQFGGSLEACTELIKMYASQLKSTDSVGEQTVSEYLRRNKDKHEFRLVIDDNGRGYIHALGQDSETLDFQI